MWLKFYEEDGTLDSVINSDKISSMFTRKNSATWARTTVVCMSDGDDSITVNKPIEEIMEMIEKGDDTKLGSLDKTAEVVKG
jgi:glutathionyl-hydroquinone reductase